MALPGLRHLRSLKLPVGRVRAGASLAKLVLDVPFMVEAYGRMAFGKYDVVHAVEEAAHLAAPMARLLGLPLVVDVDSSIPDQLRYSGFARSGPLPWLAERLETHALRHSAAVVTVCTSLTEGVRAKAPQARVFQIEDPPLVDAAQSPAPEAVAALRQSLGLGPEPIVLYSGNFEPYQGVSLLAEAAARVKEAQFLFMGGEPDEIDALRAPGRGLRGAMRVLGQASAHGAAGLPGPGRCPRLPPHAGRKHAVQDLHLPGLRQAARGHAHPLPHPAPRRLAGVAGGGKLRGPGERHSDSVSPGPRKQRRGRTLAAPSSNASTVPTRFREKVQRVYEELAKPASA